MKKSVPLLMLGGASALAKNDCYCLPGDSCWPSTSKWDALNSTVGGRLVATVPLGSPCHDPNYDADACAALQNSWTLPQTHLPSSSSVMQAYFANQSCDPFTSEATPCTLGNYVSYAVNVTSAQDIANTIKFARKNNIRFLVRNTGHDFLGRSTGAGALSAWTHYLKNTEVKDWSDSHYSGKAMTLGAGIVGYEALAASAASGLVLVSGECPTVGVAGGYTQGGGHSALSTAFGLAADQTLAFEVVTADGQIVTASRTENEDLYWALSGGGPATYGVVTSVTVRAYPDAPVGGMYMQFTAAGGADNFHEAINYFHTQLPGYTDAGATVVYYFNNVVFLINPVTIYNSSKAAVTELMTPFINKLDSLNITYQVTFTEFASYYNHYATFMGPLPYGRVEVEAYQFGSRLIPRSVLDTPSEREALFAVFKNITDAGVLAVGTAANYSAASVTDPERNAVLPAWRDATIQMQLTTAWDPTNWDAMLEGQRRMTEEFVPAIEAVTPGSGGYMNEADFRQPNWKETFFGSNYNRLLEIKNKWDPKGVFYGIALVGSDKWTVQANGRMCRA